MIGDTRRLQNSTLISSAFHAGIFLLYLLLRASSNKEQPVITHVELLDLNPAVEQQPAGGPAGAQQAPRGITDFIRMAIPHLKPAEPAEAGPQDMPVQNVSSAANQMPSSMIKLDNRNLAHGSIRLNADVPSGKQASSDVFDVKSKNQNADALEMSAPGEGPAPSINLEAVGRKAVPGGGGASIRIDDGAPATGSASLADVGGSPGGQIPSGKLADTDAGSGISLNGGSGPRRGGSIPSLPIGYGAGSGISLSDKPGFGSGGSGLAMPAAPARPAPVEKLQSQPKSARHKGIEISGPLAHRKILGFVQPVYPDWAKEQGIEAEVAIRFFVSPDGLVLERMLIERTSGYKEIDDLAMESLKKWTFVAVDGEEDQWGIVTFRFKLK